MLGLRIASWPLDLEAKGAHLLGAIPRRLPRIGSPVADWSWALLEKLIPTAFGMLVVILAQSAATSRA